MTTVSWNTPLLFNTPRGLKEHLYNFTENYLSLNRRHYVEIIKESPGLVLERSNSSPFLSTTFKVAAAVLSFFTLPLFCLLVKAIRRTLNPYIYAEPIRQPPPLPVATTQRNFHTEIEASGFQLMQKLGILDPLHVNIFRSQGSSDEFVRAMGCLETLGLWTKENASKLFHNPSSVSTALCILEENKMKTPSFVMSVLAHSLPESAAWGLAILSDIDLLTDENATLILSNQDPTDVAQLFRSLHDEEIFSQENILFVLRQESPFDVIPEMIFLNCQGRLTLANVERVLAGEAPEDVAQDSRSQTPLPALEKAIDDLYRLIWKTPHPLSNLLSETEENRQALILWLHRLQEIPQARSRTEVSTLFFKKVALYLEHANDNPQARSALFSVIHGATTTCGDRVALSVLEIGIAYQLDRLINQLYATSPITADKTYPLAHFLKRVWAMSCLSSFATEKCRLVMERKKAEGIEDPEEIEAIEIFLGIFVFLKERLHLPIEIDEMCFPNQKEWTNRELEEIGTWVEESLSSKQNFHEFLITQPIWEKALFHLFPQTYGEALSLRDLAEDAEKGLLEFQATLLSLTDEALQKI